MPVNKVIYSTIVDDANNAAKVATVTALEKTTWDASEKKLFGAMYEHGFKSGFLCAIKHLKEHGIIEVKY